MPYGERIFNPSGDRAEGDLFFEQSVYYGTSGVLSIGMPLFKDLLDAAQFNTKIAATAQTNAANTDFPTPPGIVRTGGRAVLATDARTTINAFMGIYAPENPADRPNNGDVIRILIYGEAICSVISQTGNTNAIAVGGLMSFLATQNSMVAIGTTPAARVTAGIVLATGAVFAVGATLTGGAVAGNAAILVNGFISQT